jgi:hypothetical protein
MAVDWSLARVLVGAIAVYCFGCGPSENTSAPHEDPGPIDARENLALFFDGDDYANSGTAGFPFPEAAHSISFWLNHDGGVGVRAALVLRKDWESGLAIGLREGLLGAWNVFGPRTFVEDTTPLAAGVWHHVAYVYDGTLHRLFTDGREVSSGEREPTRRTPTTGWLGSADGFREFYLGKLDDVRIWTAARTPAQLGAEVAGDAPVTDPALVAYWTFNEVSGAKVYDRSGRNNHAILGDGIELHAPVRVPAQR